MLTNTLFRYVSQTSFEEKSAAIQKVLWSPFLLLAWWNCIIFWRAFWADSKPFEKFVGAELANLNFGRIFEMAAAVTTFVFAAITQVWPQFIFLFVQNQWTLIGETLSSFVPPSHSLVSVSNPWRTFGADTAPFKGLCLALCVASGSSEKQGYRQKQVTRVLLKTHFLTPILDYEKSIE